MHWTVPERLCCPCFRFDSPEEVTSDLSGAPAPVPSRPSWSLDASDIDIDIDCPTTKSLGTLSDSEKNHDPLATDDDAQVLAEMGYKQELYRGFSGFMSFAFCFTTVSVIPSISLGFSSAVPLGGPVEIVWAWLIGSVFSIISGLAMAEITSVYPSAGSVYHWAGQLAPANYAPAWSYVTGWFNLLGNMAGTVSFAFANATVISFATAISTGQPLATGQQVGLSIGVLLAWGLMNLLRTDGQGWLNNFSVFFQLASFGVIVIVLLAMTPQHATGSFVFTYQYDGTGLSNDPNSLAAGTVILGITSCLYAFTGYEAGAHMAEETRDARRAAPWGIVGTVATCAVCGFIYILGLLFATPDVTALTTPVMDIYTFAAGQGGGLGLMILLIIMYFLSGSSSFTTASRIMFAMARDGALPFSESIRIIFPMTQAPIGAICAVALVNGLFLLLPLVSTAALNAFIGTCTIGYQMSYAFPILLRCTSARKSWVPGQWNLGDFSFPVAVVAAVWQIGTSFLFLWPTTYPVTASSMNWTVLVVALVLVVSGLNWIFGVRHTFRGPKREEKGGPASQEKTQNFDWGPEEDANKAP